MANTKIPVELSSTPGIVDNSDATAITIDSSESVGIGTTSPTSHLHLESTGATTFRVRTTSSSSEPQIIMIDGAGDYFSMQKVDRGMTFKPQGAEEVRIDADGLKFNGDTSASNALDDYEEGTYTPVMNSSNLTYSYQTGWYIKIGRHVTVGIHIDINTNGNGSGVAIGDISLPFTPSLGGAAYYSMTSSVWCNGWSTATKSDVGLVSHDYGYIVTRKSSGQGSLATPTHGDLGGGNILMTVSYQTA